MVGRTLGHYKIIRQLGSGGMGDVYLAEDTSLDGQVALKVLPSDLASGPERQRRLQRPPPHTDHCPERGHEVVCQSLNFLSLTTSLLMGGRYPMKACMISLASVLLLSPVIAIISPAEAITAEAPQTLQRVWLGADGNELPFQTDAEILEFLKTAEIVDTQNIPVGVTMPKRALLEKDGVRLHATFKDIDETAKRVRLSDGTRVMELRDFYMFEYAAYELSLLLGLDNVPPTVIRKPRRTEGSLQMWLENSMTETERREKGLQPSDVVGWRQQVQAMYLFDDLIGNIDRNMGDIVIDSEWKLWMIDHSRAFQSRFEPKHLAEVIYVERGFWEKLQALGEDQIRERIGHSLTGPEIEGLLERRDIIVAHVQKLIAERTEEVVLYDRQ